MTVNQLTKRAGWALSENFLPQNQTDNFTMLKKRIQIYTNIQWVLPLRMAHTDYNVETENTKKKERKCLITPGKGL